MVQKDIPFYPYRLLSFSILLNCCIIILITIHSRNLADNFSQFPAVSYQVSSKFRVRISKLNRMCCNTSAMASTILGNGDILLKYLSFYFAGQPKCYCFYAAVPFWCILRLRPTERARMQKYCVDSRVYFTKEQI